MPSVQLILRNSISFVFVGISESCRKGDLLFDRLLPLAAQSRRVMLDTPILAGDCWLGTETTRLPLQTAFLVVSNKCTLNGAGVSLDGLGSSLTVTGRESEFHVMNNVLIAGGVEEIL